MKKLLTVLFMLFTAASLSFAQGTDKVKFGVQFNPFISANEFPQNNLKLSWLGRGLVRFGLGEYINAEVGVGYGQYAGIGTRDGYPVDYYNTAIIPADFRLLIKLINADTYPYIYLGAGGMYYKVDNLLEIINPDENWPKEVKDNKGFAGHAPAGIGAQIDMGAGVAMDLHIGIVITSTDNLNNYIDGSAPDAWYEAGIGLLLGSGIHDDDMDGLMSDIEEQLGTDPNNPDTDNDGLKGGEEVKTYMTNPLNKDTDGDGLTDGQEVMNYRTDPTKADTDGDGLNDGDEVLKYKTDPLKADTDGDGLRDGDEVLKYKTDPLKADTDGDGLRDGDEVLKYKTDPLKADTDGDGLNDGDEVLKYKTDPLKADTDGGTINDGIEVKRGTDPLNPEDDVVKIGVPIVLEGITFATNKAEITPESEKILMGALKTLQTYPEIVVEISGHTDNVGSNSSNQKLSQLRAEAVKGWLISKGISADRVIAVGYGEGSPRVANDTAENKRLNRRIEFKRIK
jgi:outer membrane protein OmpA-like peptidoglycan-associated protein